MLGLDLQIGFFQVKSGMDEPAFSLEFIIVVPLQLDGYWTLLFVHMMFYMWASFRFELGLLALATPLTGGSSRYLVSARERFKTVFTLASDNPGNVKIE
jgi:hypothetical protein